MTNDTSRISFLPSREDVLICRVTDGEATPADWAELESLARADPAVWQRLAASQQAHARFEHAVEDEIAICELVEAPDRRVLARGAFAARVREYSGWLAAAAVAVAWLGINRAPAPNLGPIAQPGDSMTAGYSGSQPLLDVPADQLLEQYKRSGMASGTFLTELPLQFVESRASADNTGEQEVIYIRPMLERVRAKDVNVVNYKKDENGVPQKVETTPLMQRTPTAF